MPVPFFFSCVDCLRDIPRISHRKDGSWVCRHCGYVFQVDPEDLSEITNEMDLRRGPSPAPLAPRSTFLPSPPHLQTDEESSSSAPTASESVFPTSTDSPLEHESLQPWPAFIQTICNKGDFDANLRSTAANLYRQLPATLTSGSGWEQWAAYCVLRARCENGVENPRRVAEVSRLSGIRRKALNRCAWTYRQSVVAQQGTVSAPRVGDVIPKVLEQLHLPGSLHSRISILVTRWKESPGASGKKPQTIAGSATYFIAHLHGHIVSWKDVSKAAGTSEHTLKELYRDMYQKRGGLVTEELRQEWHVDLNVLPTIGSR